MPTNLPDPVYLDFNATTPVAPEVLETMLPWLRDRFGNPSSTHRQGRGAAQAVATARQQVAELIGAQPQEIVCTGCATESDNLALLGVARALGASRRHLTISAIEHPAVAAPATVLREQGWDVTIVPVDEFGFPGTSGRALLVGRDTTRDEIERAAEALKRAWRRIRTR